MDLSSLVTGAIQLAAKLADWWDGLWKAKQDPKVVSSAEAKQSTEAADAIRQHAADALKTGNLDDVRKDLAQ